MKKRSPLRVVIAAIALVVVVIAAGVIATAALRNSTPATTFPAVTASPSGTPSPSETTTATPNPGSETIGTPDDLLPAVGAAANFADVLSAAQFLPAEKARNVVNSMVDAPQREALLAALAQSGPIVAKAWGYPSVADANAAAVYSVQTKQYKVLEHDATNASVALYVVTHWVTADNTEYNRPGITIVHVRKVNGEWYFVSTEAPSSTEVPTLKPNLSFQQTEDLYQPYLEGYKEFDGNVDIE